jgi:hypothetical protein
MSTTAPMPSDHQKTGASQGLDGPKVADAHRDWRAAGEEKPVDSGRVMPYLLLTATGDRRQARQEQVAKDE